MQKYIEVTGNTVAEAIQKGIHELNVSILDVDTQVLVQPKSGFFGFGASKAKVRLTVKETNTKEKEQKQNMAENIEQIKKSEPIMKENLNKNEQKAKEFVDGLLEKMGIEGKAIITDTTEENIINISICGNGLGNAIGRRGDTLDAIQYITNLVVKNASEEYVKIRIDCENYRAKREETLEKLAIKMAQKTIKYKKNMTLEPMNPYERRKIHEVLQNFRGVSTHSIGKEPARRVVITLKQEEK